MGTRDKLKAANQQAMEIANVSTNNPEIVDMNAIDVTLAALEKEKSPEVIEKTNIENSENKNKPGRPAKWSEPHTRLSFIVSNEMKEAIETASIIYNNSITDYITTLIKEDLEKNYEAYKKQEEILKSFARR